MTIFLVIGMKCVAESVDISLTRSNGVQKLSLDKNTTKFEYGQDYENARFGQVLRIEGLDKLAKLQELSLFGFSSLKDYSFIGKIKSIQILRLTGCNVVDYAFISQLKCLRGLIIQSANGVASAKFSFTSDDVEYIEISNCQLRKIPTFLALNRSKCILNLFANSISHLSTINQEELERFKLAILISNEIKVENPSAMIITTGRVKDYIPVEYRKYMQ